jgi:ATP-binding cassette, subfamily B, bacterial MsbA
MAKKQPKINGIAVYRRLLAYVRAYWWAFLIAILATVLLSSLDSAFTYLLKPILDKGFVARDMHFISFLPFLIFGIFLLRGISSIASSYFMVFVARSIVMQFRQQIFARLLKLPAGYYDKHSSGQILAIILYNVEQVSSAASNAVTTIVQSGCFIIGLLVVMLVISWQLTLLFFILMPVITIAVRFSNKRLRNISLSLQDTMGSVTSIAEEAIEGYKVVRSFGGQDYESNKFNKVTIKNRFKDLKATLTKTLTVSGVQLISAVALCITIYLATHHSMSHVLTAGSFAAFIAAMLALLKPLKNFTSVTGTIQKGIAGAQSVFELLDEPVEIDEGIKHLDRAKGDIDFTNVSFKYPRGKKDVLSDINFTVKSGQIVALVGRSGGGKSTLVSILQRFYDGYEGEIILDGTNIHEFVLADLRQQFAFVSQHVTLFNDTVAHNIAYGRFAEASEDEIIAAAKAANAWEFIEQMPDKLNTLVGENGVLLSGGQRQRIAIARAILKKAPILILDEATSALDTESERQIQAALDKLIKNQTTLVIAHRLSTIENADVILVVDHGRIIEQGDHETLLAQNGVYAKLYKMQFREI